jgi:DNA-directed RNA polymerase subunit RPC12/RpoP
MTCKGICLRHKAQKPIGLGRYALGQKRCQICEIFIKWDGLWCPCCGYRLRIKPRNLKYKAKLRSRKRLEEATRTEQQQSQIQLQR